MKKMTSKINTIKGKLTVALLTLAMMFSMFSFGATKVSAAQIEINPYETAQTMIEYYEAVENLVNRISNDDIEKMKKVGIQTLVAALGEFVPGGKTMGPAISEFLGASMLSHQTSLDDVNDNINGLYDRINQFEEDMKKELGNVISINNFDYSIFTNFNSEIKRINDAIQLAKANPNIKQQIAIIGAQIGKDLEWKKGSSPLVGFTSVTDKINSSNILDGKDLFMAVYKYFAQRCMFSGEAIDKAKVVLDKIMENYAAGYSVLLECLTAQLMVNAFENKDGIDPYYLDNISTNVSEIMQTIDNLNKDFLGKAKNGSVDKSGTVSEKYYNIVNKNRMIFIDKDRTEKYLWGDVDVIDHNELWSNNEDQAVGSFNQLVWSGRCLAGDQIKHLAEYAKEKGMTIRELFNANGIYTDNMPKNTNLATSKAYDDLGPVDFLSGIVGSVHLHGLYKGINIDEKNPSEKEIRMWNHGCNGYCISTWDYAEPGYAATIGYLDR